VLHAKVANATPSAIIGRLIRWAKGLVMDICEKQVQKAVELIDPQTEDVFNRVILEVQWQKLAARWLTIARLVREAASIAQRAYCWEFRIT